jgi:hypothetical protein
MGELKTVLLQVPAQVPPVSLVPTEGRQGKITKETLDDEWQEAMQ